ncbi:DDE Tnp4 domain-containing protein [Aphis craccivora]|uniref:DDE Tnp4 domain-containing protein n=1 Tax=Aphis craccivora TaxID=307492 RepID=A0A6G0VJ80_APHCR|nr:DDE Tnp4 domain-containing protein [Aphis craccivora]
MTSADFEYLLNLIDPSISKQYTHLRKSIPARKRLAVTLRFLANGDSYQMCNALKTKLSDQVKSNVPSITLVNASVELLSGGDISDERLGVEEFDGDGCDV